MKLNALDIRKQEFSTRFRGYDPDEVEGFVQMMAQQWQEMTDDMRRLEQRIDEQATKLNHYMKVEEALEQALETAREGARQRLETADQRASATVDDAERRARALLEDAEYRSRTLLDESEKRARTIVGEAERRGGAFLAEAEDRHIRARQAVSDASMRRGEIVARLRAFLATEMELLSGFEGAQEPEWTATEAAAGRRAAVEQHPFRPYSTPVLDPVDSDDLSASFETEELPEPEFEAPTPAEVWPSVGLVESRPMDPAVEVVTMQGPFPEPVSVNSARASLVEDRPVEVSTPAESLPSTIAATVFEAPTTVEEPRAVDKPVAAVEPTVVDEPAAAVKPTAAVEPPAADEPTVAEEPAAAEEPRVRRVKPKTPASKQADLLDDSGEYGGASDEIKKIRRILEDLDR